MKARLLDEIALRAISPTALRAYLLYEGWRRLESFGEFSEVYVNAAEGDKKEILVPVSAEIADYASAISQVIRLVSTFESRDELTIYSDLTRADRDVIRVRAPDADDDGSIRIDNGVEIVQRSRDMLASGACAAIETRRAYRLGKMQVAQDYMRRVRLGQTEHGSFVVALLAPIPPALSLTAQIPFWPEFELEPYERQVTRVLSRSLHSAQAAIVASNRGDGANAFNEAISSGVSANLCEAIASIIDQTNSVEISVTWAKTRPAPIAREQVVFSETDGEILREAARQFLLKEPRRDERIIGYVTNLRRQEDQFDGRITIKAIVDGKVKSVSADLLKPEYEVALRAHEIQAPITILGDIETEGRRLRLRDGRDIQIIEDESE
jgi:hypothetical protein